MDKKTMVWLRVFLVVFCISIFFIGQVYGADSNGEYLQYQEPKPTTSVSWYSTISYIFSLIITFAFVIGLAYFASRFLGKKLGGISANGNSRIINVLSLGTNRAVYTVEIVGKFLVLGVTDHSITVLQEITDDEAIKKLKNEQLTVPKDQFDGVFQRQIASLQQLSKKIPATFGANQQNEQKHEREKR